MRRNYFTISDSILLLIVILIMIYSLLALYSATYKMIDIGSFSDYWIKQMIWMIIGFLAMLFIANVKYKNITKITYPLYITNIILLILVFIIGKKSLGAQRWLSFAGFTLQPSELMKIVMVITLAKYFDETSNMKWNLRKLIISGMLTALPMALIFKQPDLGTMLVFISIYISIIYIANCPLKYIFSLFGIGLVSLPLAWTVLKEYQKKRITIFLNPYDDQFGAGWPMIQSKIAIGSGKLFGKGFLKGSQTQLNFLPEHHTDFIFSVLGEEFGFIGTIVLLGLFLLFITRSINIASQTEGLFGKLIVTGIISIIFFQVLVNVGMTIGFLPITGIPLPLMSYGGSAVFSMLCAIGLIFSVKKQRL